jgi:hypothetical protein
MRTLYIAALVLPGFCGSALAVDLKNSDSGAHSVFICDSTCKPPTDHNYSREPGWGGKTLNISAGETLSSVCNGTCEIVVEDGTLTTIEDLGFSERFTGSEVATIRKSLVEKN